MLCDFVCTLEKAFVKKSFNKNLIVTHSEKLASRSFEYLSGYAL